MTAHPDPFFDTNVLLYLISRDTKKADAAEELLGGGGNISVQVLNEFAFTAIHKYGIAMDAVREALDVVRRLCAVEPPLL